jgi:hypothetical protein
MLRMHMTPAPTGEHTRRITLLTRKLALLVVAVAAVAAIGLGLNTRGASAAPGLQAVSGGPYAAVVGQAIQFDGSASSGLGGLSYFWTFGDGTSAVGATPVKVYGRSGVFHVTLTVQDFSGATSVAATTATVGGVRSIVPVGCFTNVFGNVICGTTFSGVSGCVLTGAGWVCPGVGTIFPHQIGSGVIVNSTAIPSATFNPIQNCTNPDYAFSPFCRRLQ